MLVNDELTGLGNKQVLQYGNVIKRSSRQQLQQNTGQKVSTVNLKKKKKNARNRRDIV